MKILDVFPLSIVSDNIILRPENKKEIISQVLKIERDTNSPYKKEERSWLGDIEGHEAFLSNCYCKDLSKLIGEKLRLYTEIFEIDNQKVNFYIQRSWPTITRKNEHIKLHKHSQSHISFVYYLKKPENSAGIEFTVERYNEMAQGIFDNNKHSLGFLKKINTRNSDAIGIQTEEDTIIMFPSKIEHGTVKSLTDEPRISISGDVCLVLKDSKGHETLFPPLKQWQLV